MAKYKTEFWFSDEHTASEAVEIQAAASMPPTEAKSFRDTSTDVPLLSVVGNVGVIDIKGTMYADANWMTEWLGLATYPTIRNALVTAAKEESIDMILLNIDSPGGSAKGVSDISNLVSSINASHKPVHTFTQGGLDSAAYFIAAPSQSIMATKMATVGSIGVVATHFDLTEAMKKEGVKATVFRSAELKGVGGPHEKLSPKVIDNMQSRIDELAHMFSEHVAESRGLPLNYVKDTLATGEDFLGAKAVELKLADTLVSGIEEAIQMISPKKQPSKAGKDMKTKMLNEQEIAMQVASMEQAEETQEEGATEAEEKTEAPEAQASSLLESELTVFLKAEISDSRAKEMEMALELKTIKAEMESMKATHSALMGVAADFTNFRNVALNRQKTDFSSFSAEALLQAYNAVSTDYHATFKAGAKTLEPSTEVPKAIFGNSNIQTRAVKAVRPQ